MKRCKRTVEMVLNLAGPLKYGSQPAFILNMDVPTHSASQIAFAAQFQPARGAVARHKNENAHAAQIKGPTHSLRAYVYRRVRKICSSGPACFHYLRVNVEVHVYSLSSQTLL